MLVIASLLFAVPAIPTIASAQPAPPVQEAGNAAHAEKSRALVELINPSNLMVQTNMRAWEAGVKAMLRQDPGAVKIEAAYPGAIEAAIAAARPVGRRYCEDYVEKAAVHKAGLIAKGLSDAELDEAIRWHRGPVWTRFVTRFSAAVDPSAMVTEWARKTAETGKLAITQESANKTALAAAAKVSETVSADEQVEMMRFQQTSVAAKLRAIGVEADRKVIEWANSPDPATVAKQQEAIQRAIIAFVDAKKK